VGESARADLHGCERELAERETATSSSPRRQPFHGTVLGPTGTSGRERRINRFDDKYRGKMT
jgi:hypothetical protein